MQYDPDPNMELCKVPSHHHIFFVLFFKAESLGLRIKDLMERVGRSPALHGRRMHVVSLPIWQAELRQLSERNPMFPLLSRYQDGLPGRRAGSSEEDYDSGYSQEEVDRFVAFLEAAGQLGAVPDLPMLVRTSSVEKQHSFHHHDSPG